MEDLGFHSQSIGHGMRWDETAWQNECAVPLTFCWSWDEMGWDCLAEWMCSATHKLLVMRWDCPAEKEVLHHSHTVGHGMKLLGQKGSSTHLLWFTRLEVMTLPGRSSTYFLLVMERWDARRLWQTKHAILLTCYWLCIKLPLRGRCSVTYFLLFIRWYLMTMPSRQ